MRVTWVASCGWRTWVTLHISGRRANSSGSQSGRPLCSRAVLSTFLYNTNTRAFQEISSGTERIGGIFCFHYEQRVLSEMSLNLYAGSASTDSR